LIIDGEEHGLLLPDSRYVYESAVPLSQVVSPPLSADAAKLVLEIMQGFDWTYSIHARLAAGWIAIAPVCGSLKWRPSIWLTGSTGSGKTTLQHVISSLLGGMSLNVASKTSEAGIRQALASDARPVLFDEFEAEDVKAKGRVQEVLDLVRQSSSEGGAEIIKGTSNQSGAKRYLVRSAFAFSSINVSLNHYADENRISVLSLSSLPDKEDKVALQVRDAHWKKLNIRITDELTPEWCAGLVARSVRMAQTIRQNAETFAQAASKYFGSRRLGDQIGTLLAGAHSLESDDLITADYAEQWLNDNGTKFDATETDFETDEQRLLNFLMQVRLRMAGGNGSIYERTLGELIAAARGIERQPKDQSDEDCYDLVPATQARAELTRNGIKYKYEVDNTALDASGRPTIREGIFVANGHSTLARLLAGTPWSSQWQRSLIRLRGAEKSKGAEKFSHGAVHRAIWLPISVVLPG
jgi:putative DNA primase/helicase